MGRFSFFPSRLRESVASARDDGDGGAKAEEVRAADRATRGAAPVVDAVVASAPKDDDELSPECADWAAEVRDRGGYAPASPKAAEARAALRSLRERVRVTLSVAPDDLAALEPLVDRLLEAARRLACRPSHFAPALASLDVLRAKKKVPADARAKKKVPADARPDDAPRPRPRPAGTAAATAAIALGEGFAGALRALREVAEQAQDRFPRLTFVAMDAVLAILAGGDRLTALDGHFDSIFLDVTSVEYGEDCITACVASGGKMKNAVETLCLDAPVPVRGATALDWLPALDRERKATTKNRLRAAAAAAATLIEDDDAARMAFVEGHFNQFAIFGLVTAATRDVERALAGDGLAACAARQRNFLDWLAKAVTLCCT